MTKYERQLLQTIILGVLIILSSCKKDENPVVVQPKPDVILPLNVNNQWTYKRTYFDSLGAVSQIDTFSCKVLRDTVIQSEIWSIMSYWGTAYRNKADGCWAAFSQPTLLYKYPAFLNETFLSGQDTVSVVSTNTITTVPAGTFACYSYERDFYGLPYHTLLSPKIGLIKDDWVVRINNGPPFINAQIELISYSLL